MLLLDRNDETIQKIVQIPIGSVLNNFSEIQGELNLWGMNMIPITDLVAYGSSRTLENIRDFSVSGLRKVAVFLFQSKKRIRIFEMEVEDDEEEDDNDTTLGNSGISSELNSSI